MPLYGSLIYLIVISWKAPPHIFRYIAIGPTTSTMNEDDEGVGFHSSSGKQVFFSDIVQEIFVEDVKTSQLYENDTELDFTELSSEPTAYDFGDGLHSFADLPGYDDDDGDCCEESSVSEDSAHENGLIRELRNQTKKGVDDDEESMGQRHDATNGFFMGCFEFCSLLVSWAGGIGFFAGWTLFTSKTPIDETDVVAAVGKAQSGNIVSVVASGGGGGGGATGVVVIP